MEEFEVPLYYPNISLEWATSAFDISPTLRSIWMRREHPKANEFVALGAVTSIYPEFVDVEKSKVQPEFDVPGTIIVLTRFNLIKGKSNDSKGT